MLSHVPKQLKCATHVRRTQPPQQQAETFYQAYRVILVNEDTYKVKATVETPAGRINASVQIYAEGVNHIVEIRRRRGNTLKFQQLYNSICDELADIITVGDTVL